MGSLGQSPNGQHPNSWKGSQTQVEMLNSEQDSAPITDSSASTPTPATSLDSGKVYRINDVPSDVSKEELKEAIKAMDLTLKDAQFRLKMYPSSDPDFQTVLLQFSIVPAYFGTLVDDDFNFVKIHLGGDNETDDENKITITIDDTFYGLTQLNDPTEDVVADLVAVTGLGGHAYGSWRNRRSEKMWLQDFLPKKFNNMRIMTYGYDSKLAGEENTDNRLVDYRNHFLNALNNARSSITERKRPIIFIGHSLGAVLIVEAFTAAKSKELVDATQCIMFFGAPHKGLDTSDLELMADNVRGEWGMRRGELVRNLEKDAECLQIRLENFGEVVHRKGSDSLRIISFFEQKKTPKYDMTLSGFKPGKEMTMRAERSSSLLYWPNEEKVGVQEDHSNMVKFGAASNETYKTVVRHLGECLEKITKEKSNEFSEDQRLCLNSLKLDNATDCETYRKNLFAKRHENTCNWIFDDERYTRWTEEGNSSILWIEGGPGFGKSVLSAVISKELKHTPGNTDSILYFFCDDKNEHLRTAEAVLRNLLSQLLKQDRGVLSHFLREEEYNIHKEKTSWTNVMLWRVFDRIARDSRVRPMRVIIDALDECDGTRKQLLQNLHALFKEVPTARQRVRLLLTGRPPARHELDDITNIDIILLDTNSKFLEQDIKAYVDSEVAKLPHVTECSRSDIQQFLNTGANCMFLWVSLILDELKVSPGYSTAAIREKLKSLPKTLTGFYEHILQRVTPEARPSAMEILRWMVFALQPLTLRELATLLAIIPGETTSIASLNDTTEPNLWDYILQCNLGALVEVHLDKTVHLIHQSAKEFLKSSEYFVAKQAHFDLALTSLTHIWLTVDLPRGRYLDIYAWTHWASHVKKFEYHAKDEEEDFKKKDRLWEAFRKIPATGIPEFETGYSAFHLQLAAQKGLEFFVQKLLDKYNIRLSTRGPLERFYSMVVGDPHTYEFYIPVHALIDAARNGHTAVIRLLLDHDTISFRHAMDRALYEATLHGHESVVRLLIKHGAKVNARGRAHLRVSNTTALHAAVRGGNESLSRLLIDNGAKINVKDAISRSSVLHEAAKSGVVAIVRLLISRGAKVNAIDEYLCSPLLQALRYGHGEVARLLIDAGADLDVQAQYGGAVLLAVESCHDEPLIRLLIDRGAKVNVPRSWGVCSALHSAARSGAEATVRLLLESGADVVNDPGFGGSSPLVSAVKSGNATVVRLLIDGGAKVNARSSRGTVLCAAAFRGNEATLRLLLEAGADVDAVGNKYPGTPLQTAVMAKAGTEVVRLLIDFGADVNANNSESALGKAILQGDEAMVRLLIDAGADVNAKNGVYMGALWTARFRENNAIYSLLIDAGAQFDETVLRTASSRGIASSRSDISADIISDMCRFRS